MTTTRDPVSVRRMVLLWMHLLCAGLAGFVLLSQESLNPHLTLSVGGRSQGAYGALLALPALWPYIASFLTSRNVVVVRRPYLGIYWVLLVLSTVAIVAVILVSRSLKYAFVASCVQAAVFILASDRIADYDYRRSP